MIVANLIGGLGNQLFQFACGHAVAARLGVPLQVAVDGFAGYRLHQGFELTRAFALDPVVAGEAELRALLGPWRHPQVRRLLAWLRPAHWRGGRMVFEPDERHGPGIEQVRSPAYLHGYWQSERYFEGEAAALRAALRFRDPPSAENAAWLERIDGCVAVSLHARRGDYLSNPKNRGIYAECTPAYYQAAVERLLALHPQAQFFAFSDDPPWLRGVLAAHAGRLHVVEHNRGAASHQDLRLMSRCRHHVIANSTFSWWGAWLGERPGQTVIAPRDWFVDPRRGADIVPARWQRL